MNYPKKIATNGFKPTSRPPIVLFSKKTSCFVGSGSCIRIPVGKAGKSLDYEGELAVIIGKTGRHIKKKEAMNYVFGFTAINDGSIRKWQSDSVFAGKNFESSSSCGPYVLVNENPKKEKSFNLITRLNGHPVQKASTNSMIYNIKEILSYISNITILKPGDIIATGSPHGSGWHQRPPKFLKIGDNLEVEISHIGILKNKVKKF